MSEAREGTPRDTGRVPLARDAQPWTPVKGPEVKWFRHPVRAWWFGRKVVQTPIFPGTTLTVEFLGLGPWERRTWEYSVWSG